MTELPGEVLEISRVISASMGSLGKHPGSRTHNMAASRIADADERNRW
jgi:hypothetical protein